MTLATASRGTTFKWNGNAVAEVLVIGEPGFKRDLIDVTNFSSPDGFKEFIAGWAEGDEISIEMNFIPTDTNGQLAFLADVNAGTTREAIISGPAGIWTWTFDAVPTGFKPSFGVKDQNKATGTMKLTGKPVFGYTAAADLTGLTITTATLVPSFAGDVYEYAATTTGTSFTVTPTCAAADEITVNGAVVASGVPSSAIATASVGVYDLVVVVKENDKVSTTYTILVTKTA